MRSSLRVERLPVATARYGQVLAAGLFTHPERGLVECAAAWLLASGKNVLLRPGEVPELCRPGQGDGVMFAVSWLERSGTVAGFALVAHRDDRAGLEAAERDVAAWTAVVRSRRLLVAATGGLCPGARRAAGVIRQAARDADAPVFVLGRPIADEATLMQMRRSEIRFAASLDEVPDDGVVVYPAHGAGLQAHAEAAARALAVVDGTCPLVAAAQADAFRNAERGDVVVVVGRAAHAVVPSLAGHAGPRATDLWHAPILPGEIFERLPIPALLLDAMLRTAVFANLAGDTIGVVVPRRIGRVTLYGTDNDADLMLCHPSGIHLTYDAATETVTAIRPDGTVIAAITGLDLPLLETIAVGWRKAPAACASEES